MVESLGMAKITMYKTLPLIEASGIIVTSRKIGKTQLYRLNGDSSAVKHIRGIIRDISFKMAEDEVDDQVTPSVQEELVQLSDEERS